MGAGEKNKFAVLGGVAMLFGIWIQDIAGDDYGGGVRASPALDGDALRITESAFTFWKGTES